MNDNIYVDSNKLNVIIESLKNKRNTLVNTLNNQMKIIEDIKECWNGTNGEKVYLLLKEHSKKYDRYIKDVDENIVFLEQVKKAYRNLDNALGNKIDSADIEA